MTEYVRPDGTDALSFPESRAAGCVVAWYNTDRQGSVRALTDDTGHGAGHAELHRLRGGDREQRRLLGTVGKYTGRERDGVSQLQYNRDRYYDPNTATWTTQDPMWLRRRRRRPLPLRRQRADQRAPTPPGNPSWCSNDSAAGPVQDFIRKLFFDYHAQATGDK